MVMQKKERVTVDGEEGKIIPFWKAAPPEDSLRSWERRRKKKERKRERNGGGQQRTRHELGLGKGSLCHSNNTECTALPDLGVTVSSR